MSAHRARAPKRIDPLCYNGRRRALRTRPQSTLLHRITPRRPGARRPSHCTRAGNRRAPPTHAGAWRAAAPRRLVASAERPRRRVCGLGRRTPPRGPRPPPPPRPADSTLHTRHRFPTLPFRVLGGGAVRADTHPPRTSAWAPHPADLFARRPGRVRDTPLCDRP